MRILVLGGDGMLGHQLIQSLSANHQVKCTLHRSASDYAPFNLFDSSNSFFDTDIRDNTKIASVIDELKPDAVVNCVGIVKQRSESKERVPSIEINSLAPHRIAELCSQAGVRFIHVSTDCVFNGRTGGYTESDPCNVSDTYGMTKYLGEVYLANSITLRTSIIGHELSRKTGLLEWFLEQKGTVKGFRKAIFSGLTTNELANVIEMLLARFPEATGLYHVASKPINKYDLLCLISKVYEKQTLVDVDDEFLCDRSLNADRFNNEFEYIAPDWRAMIATMRQEFEERDDDI